MLERCWAFQLASSNPVKYFSSAQLCRANCTVFESPVVLRMQVAAAGSKVLQPAQESNQWST